MCAAWISHAGHCLSLQPLSGEAQTEPAVLAVSALGLHRTWGVDEIDTQISRETLGTHENP